jgi:transposase
MRYKYQNLRCVYWQQRFRDDGKLKRKSGSGGKPKPYREDIENIQSTILAKPITTAQKIVGNISFILLDYYIKVY